MWGKKEKSNFEFSGFLHQSAVQKKLPLLIKSYTLHTKEGKKDTYMKLCKQNTEP